MHAFLKVMIWEIVNCFWFEENKSFCDQGKHKESDKKLKLIRDRIVEWEDCRMYLYHLILKHLFY